MPNDKDKIGYKNPPKNTQWKKGQSGNLKGRPKKEDNNASMDQFNDLIIRTMGETALVNINGGMETMSFYEIILKKLAKNAMQDDFKSIKMVTELYQKALCTKSKDSSDNGGIQIVYIDEEDRGL